MNIKYLEKIYNEMSYHKKTDVGFPELYMFLTNDQERFIMDLVEEERKATQSALLETIEEMKELINEL